MSLTDVCQFSDHELLLRKDSGESGFLEFDAEFEDEINKCVPDSFDLLPPLEQRRQNAIHDLYVDEEAFLISLDKVYLNIKDNLQTIAFDKPLEAGFADLESYLDQIKRLLQDVVKETSFKQFRYAQDSQNDSSPSSYIDCIGSYHKSKVSEVLDVYGKLITDIDVIFKIDCIEDRQQDSVQDELFYSFEDLVYNLEEYFLELQINLGLVLSCTPRKHVDHKPLREIVGELKKVNQRNESKKFEDSNWLCPEVSPQSNKVRQHSKVSRRFSLDTGPQRSVSQLSRALSFGASTTSKNLVPRHSSSNEEKPDRKFSYPWTSKSKSKSPKKAKIPAKRSWSLPVRKLSKGEETSYLSSTPPPQKIQSNISVYCQHCNHKHCCQSRNAEQQQLKQRNNSESGFNMGKEELRFDTQQQSRTHLKTVFGIFNRRRNRDCTSDSACQLKRISLSTENLSSISPRQKSSTFQLSHSGPLSLPSSSPVSTPKSTPASPSCTSLNSENANNVSSDKYVEGRFSTILENCSSSENNPLVRTEEKSNLRRPRARTFEGSTGSIASVELKREKSRAVTPSVLPYEFKREHSCPCFDSKTRSKANLEQPFDEVDINQHHYEQQIAAHEQSKEKISKRTKRRERKLCHVIGSLPTSASRIPSSTNMSPEPSPSIFKRIKYPWSSQEKHADSPKLLRNSDSLGNTNSTYICDSSECKCHSNVRGSRFQGDSSQISSSENVICLSEASRKSKNQCNLPVNGPRHHSTTDDNEDISLDANDSELSIRTDLNQAVKELLRKSPHGNADAASSGNKLGKSVFYLENSEKQSSSESSSYDCIHQPTSNSPAFNRSFSCEPSPSNGCYSDSYNGNVSPNSDKSSDSPSQCIPPTLDTSVSCLAEDKVGNRTNYNPSSQELLTSLNRSISCVVEQDLGLPSVECASKVGTMKTTSKHLITGQNRRHTVSSSESSTIELWHMFAKKSKISSEDVKKWGQNIDMLLADQKGIEVFRLFLRSEFSEENILFWLACEDLKQTRSFKVPARARRIYRTYIEVHSSQQVNLNHDTRDKIDMAMRAPSRTMFDESQHEIKLLMANDSYQRFLKSYMYTNLLK